MVPVKKLLNVVVNCEMWGRLRCAAASIGYRWEIRKGLVHRARHAAVMRRCQEQNITHGSVPRWWGGRIISRGGPHPPQPMMCFGGAPLWHECRGRFATNRNRVRRADKAHSGAP